MFWAGLANCDEGRRLGEAVHVGEFPTKLSLDQLDGRSSRWCPGGEQAHSARRPHSNIFRRIGDADKHRRSRAKHRNVLVLDELEYEWWLHPAETNIGYAAGGVDPREGPPVGVKHRQSPQISIARCQVVMDQGSDDIHVSIAVGDHDPLGPCRCSTGVVDGEEIVLGDIVLGEVGRM